MAIRTLIVDDHEMVRRGLTSYLTMLDDIEVVGEASDGQEALRQAETLSPDVILMDLVMEGMDGVEATKRITVLAPETRIIVLTSYINDDQIFPVLEAGACSYLLKTSRAEEIANAIRAAARGEATIEQKISSRILARMRNGSKAAPHEALTQRERDVLALLGEAKTNQEIAASLYIGVKTVKTHVSNILSKLELEDRTQAAVYAVKHGLTKKSGEES
ncbi:response regulator transcription factor [Desmospora profundinema]|uniref:NarL family two-component system response regulator LiaR n=1 Tax=Desmospora profundinema TaxID=1571184 RepID=A0ABU1IRA0_9BACL|nr:response regulator transcription factor [Desmospora profundinema]MDR6227321.1 NarL family two-component system response regulator LiaR [Desmospora profundinema]